MGTYTETRRRGARAIQTDAFRLLLADWQRQSTTRRYRIRLREWAQVEPALDVERGEDLIEASCYYATDEEQDRACEVLEALARLSQAGDELAMLTILRGLMTRLTYMVDRFAGPHGLDVDERAAMALTIAGETVASCVPGTATTRYDFRLWSNIRKRFGRHVDAHCRRVGQLDLTDPAVLADRADSSESDNDHLAEDHIGELCEWVADRAALDLGTARLIVLTRVGGVAVEDLVDIEGWCAQTLWKRRKRAERRLAHALNG